MNIDLNDLCYYAQVVEHGGFAPAGRALGIPKSTLSRRVAQLEARLGVQLIARSTRRFVVTAVGQRYLAHCKAMLLEAEAAEATAALAHAQPCGSLRVSCPIPLLHGRMGALLVAFAQAHPAVRMQVLGVNRPVDVVGEGIDVALRVRPLPLEDSDLAARVLTHTTPCLVASPALLAAQGGAPQQPNDLAAWPALAFADQVGNHHWQLLGPGDAAMTVPVQARFASTDLPTLRRAALAGLGAAQLPQMLVQDDLAAGRLLSLLHGWQSPPHAIHAVFASRRGLMPSVRALLDYLAQAFAAPASGEAAAPTPPPAP